MQATALRCVVALLCASTLGCETEADRRKERLDQLARTIEARLRAAELPTIPYGEPWTAAGVRVVVGEGIAVDRAAIALELYGADPDGYAESGRPIPDAGPQVLPLPNGRLLVSALSEGGTLPALSEPLRPPPPAGQMGEAPDARESLPPHRGPLDLAVGSEIPYRTFAAVLRTVVRARYSPRLVARGPRAMVQLPVHLPAIAGGCRSTHCIEALAEPRSTDQPVPEGPTRLGLTITIGEDGVDVFGSGGALARGCERTRRPGEEGSTLPRRNGTIDRGALEECLTSIDELFAEEDVVLIQPEAATPFNEIIIVASTAFGDDRFPELLFAEPQ